MSRFPFAVGFVLLTLLAYAQAPPELGQGWMPEFSLAMNHVTALAEATPAEKFSWRPAPGVRSVSEVYMHLAVSNLYLLKFAGAEVDIDKIPANFEKKITSKAEVIRWLNDSTAAVRANYSKVDQKKKVKFWNRDATADGVLLRLLA